MKIEKQLNNSHPRLLLFFAGWSASPESFTGLKAENGTDIMLCYDYRDMTFHEDLSSYKEIHLIAWSMGVRMAELALAGKYALTTATAVNGTPRPIDDNFGIPENIFRGTGRLLSPGNRHRYRSDTIRRLRSFLSKDG